MRRLFALGFLAVAVAVAAGCSGPVIKVERPENPLPPPKPSELKVA